MAGVMGRYNYVSDDGNTYRIRLDASNAAAVGAAAATVTAGKPGRTKPRYILARHPTTGRERQITVTSPTSDLWTGAASTISLPDFDALMAPTTFSVEGRVGERRLA